MPCRPKLWYRRNSGSFQIFAVCWLFPSSDRHRLTPLPAALLAYTDKATAETSNTCSDLQQQTDILAVFHTLLSFPTDYLTRAMKLSTMKRALSLDILVSVVSEDNSLTAFKLCILRVYTSRMLVNLGPTDLPVSHSSSLIHQKLIFNPDP